MNTLFNILGYLLLPILALYELVKKGADQTPDGLKIVYYGLLVLIILGILDFLI